MFLGKGMGRDRQHLGRYINHSMHALATVASRDHSFIHYGREKELLYMLPVLLEPLLCNYWCRLDSSSSGTENLLPFNLATAGGRGK